MALRWGICSAGKISHDFVVGLKTLPVTEHQVVAVAARSLESASKFAKTHSIPRHYGSYQELANDTEVKFPIFETRFEIRVAARRMHALEQDFRLTITSLKAILVLLQL